MQSIQIANCHKIMFSTIHVGACDILLILFDDTCPISSADYTNFTYPQISGLVTTTTYGIPNVTKILNGNLASLKGLRSN